MNYCNCKKCNKIFNYIKGPMLCYDCDQIIFESIKKYRAKNVPVRINYLIRKDNLDKIEYIYNLTKELNVDRLFYIFIAPQGKAYENTELLLKYKITQN